MPARKLCVSGGCIGVRMIPGATASGGSGRSSTQNGFTRAFFSRFRAGPMPAGTILQQAGNQGGPASRVTGPQPAAGVPVEVLVEEDVVTPVRVVRVALERAVTWPRPGLLWHE